MNGWKFEEVTRFKHLKATSYKDGISTAEILITIASAIAAMAILNRIWQYNTISFASRFRLYKSLVTLSLIHI